MKKLPLTQGRFALVDDEDYEWLMQWKWCAMKTRWGFTTARSRRLEDGPGTHLIYMSREIMGTPKNMECDHRDHNGLNNQRSNLRNCTQLQNAHNKAPQRDGSSKYKGVSWHKRTKKWQVHICFEGGLIFLGYFASEEEAARAYDEAALEYFGEFAYLNFPEITVACEK